MTQIRYVFAARTVIRNSLHRAYICSIIGYTTILSGATIT